MINFLTYILCNFSFFVFIDIIINFYFLIFRNFYSVLISFSNLYNHQNISILYSYFDILIFSLLFYIHVKNI